MLIILSCQLLISSHYFILLRYFRYVYQIKANGTQGETLFLIKLTKQNTLCLENYSPQNLLLGTHSL